MYRKILLVTVLGAFVFGVNPVFSQENKNPREAQIEKLQDYRNQLSNRLEELKKNVDKKPNGKEMVEKMEKELAKSDERLKRLETAGTGARNGAKKGGPTQYKKDMFELMNKINGKRVEIMKDPRIKDKKKTTEDLKTIQTELRGLMKNTALPDAEKKEKFEALKEKYENLGKPVDPMGIPLPE